ncbi:portal protein [Skermania sp. ID1734]|uniref:NAD-binding protein n=1 Tax=Skermania sp. ID1734 TaxID=2597516 RepID=UPI001180255F|nr:NAD-binding protein [Skermania sp. ID1734]TSD98123.1 portal protein [Skermania sp. ID1734]
MVQSDFLVIGETNIARRVCAALADRGDQVVHLAEPGDDQLRKTLRHGDFAVAVVTHDDVVALRYALAVAHIAPRARLVVTIFDRTIGEQLRRLLPGCEVTSPAELAAPSLAGPCLRAEYLAVKLSPTGPLALVGGDGAMRWRPAHIERTSWVNEQIGSVRGVLHDAGTKIMVMGLSGLLAVIVVGWAWTALAGHPVTESLEESVQVVTAGAASYLTNDGYAIFASLAMFAAIFLTAMVTAGLVERLLGPRLLDFFGARALPRSGHVVVVGLGQVGLRLCLELKALRVPVVAVERDAHARNLRLVRDLRIPTIVGDGADRHTLDRVSLGRARALAAVGSDDRDNIAVAIAAQAVHAGIDLVLRAGEQEALAETRSLLALGTTLDVTVLSAAYVCARLLDLPATGVVMSEAQLYLDCAAGQFVRFSPSERDGCAHIATVKAQRP